MKHIRAILALPLYLLSLLAYGFLLSVAFLAAIVEGEQ